jgi:hypothetical protein
MDFVELSGAEIIKLKLNSVLCLAHFENDCFLQYVRSRTLKGNIIPTVIVNGQNRQIYKYHIYIYM